jgi:hypothetical protein
MDRQSSYDGQNIITIARSSLRNYMSYDLEVSALEELCFLNQVVGIATALLELGAYIHWSRTLQTPPVQSFFSERIPHMKKNKEKTFSKPHKTKEKIGKVPNA